MVCLEVCLDLAPHALEESLDARGDPAHGDSHVYEPTCGLQDTGILYCLPILWYVYHLADIPKNVTLPFQVDRGAEGDPRVQPKVLQLLPQGETSDSPNDHTTYNYLCYGKLHPMVCIYLA